MTCHFVLFDLLRSEQALAVTQPPRRTEAARILDFAGAAYGDLVGLLVGRDDASLDGARDGEWTLRDILRHAIAVELRYCAQVAYSATRTERDPVAIPDERLPCDRLSPPLEFDASRTAGITPILELLGEARQRTDVAARGLTDDVLSRPSLWGKYEMDVGRRLHQVGAHLIETVLQVEKALAGDGHTEARRIMRRCCATRGLHEGWTRPADRVTLDDRYIKLAESLRT